MKYNMLGFLIGEGFGNVLKNKKSTGASLMIMCATMIIFGIFLILSENINHYVDEIKSEQGFQAFLYNDATDEDIEKAGEKIRALDGVNSAEFVSKEEAMNFMKEKMGNSELVEDMGPDYYSTSYMVKLTDLNLNDEVQSKILEFDEIRKITSSNETVTTLLGIAKGIKGVTAVILVLLVLISIFIISNTIKLTVHARRKEISIMKYVGATNSFIRWPFIVEGIIIGVASSLISIILIGGAYSILIDQAVNSTALQKINMSFVNFGDMFSSIIFVYMLLGIGIGAFGSVISMRKYLKV